MSGEDRRPVVEDYTAHAIAFVIVFGFFAIIMVALLGFVDIRDPTIAAFVGTAIGYAAGKLDPVLTRYFPALLRTPPGPPGPPRPL